MKKKKKTVKLRVLLLHPSEFESHFQVWAELKKKILETLNPKPLFWPTKSEIYTFRKEKKDHLSEEQNPV